MDKILNEFTGVIRRARLLDARRLRNLQCVGIHSVRNIRCIDLSSIDFGRIKYQSALCDPDKTQPVDMIKVK